VSTGAPGRTRTIGSSTLAAMITALSSAESARLSVSEPALLLSGWEDDIFPTCSVVGPLSRRTLHGASFTNL